MPAFPVRTFRNFDFFVWPSGADRIAIDYHIGKDPGQHELREG